jgi:hypothetical protein
MKAQDIAQQFMRHGVVCLCALGGSLARAQVQMQIPMDALHWKALDADSMGPKGDLEFARQEGFPDGVMKLKEGSAALDDVSFSDGTIEYDFKALAEDAPGIQFRMSGPVNSENGEEFYFRTAPDCRAENDCIQYTPVIHGFMLWDVYPQYQHQAFVLDGWNHVRLVVSGRRMLVYINGQSEAALSVGNLESESTKGSIHLRGPAVYANLIITPGLVGNLPSVAASDPSLEDRSIVRHWAVSDLQPISTLDPPAYSDMPKKSESWHAVEAETGGLVNLNRQYFAGDQPAAISWLRYSVLAKQAETKQVSLGWLGEAWIYVNGKLVADAKNFYYPPTERRDPDGRLSLQNGLFSLPLHAGSNEIAIALYSQTRDAIRPRMKYGWGVIMRYGDMSGLSFAPERASGL